ncbi:MAG: hypothetical protein AAF682_18995 [Planctomycetota bacterium]
MSDVPPQSSSDPATPSGPNGPIALGLFLISAAVLALQVLQTRILSVQMWHHHSYMVVTMTLLGFAAAGSLVTVRSSLLRGNVARRMGISGHLFFASTILGFLLLSQTADRAAEMTAAGSYIALSLFYSYLLLPYFFGGMVVTLALSSARDVHRLYFVNLVGSALGAWLFIAVITPLGGERLLVLCASLGAVAGALMLARESGFWRLASVGALGTAAVLFWGAPEWLAVQVASNKAETDVLENVPGAEVIDSRWTPLCRLDVVRIPEQDGVAFPIHIYQDGDAITIMHSDESWQYEPPAGLNTMAYLPHSLRMQEGGERPEALVIGVGGGIDIRYGLAQGARSVLGIEINSETVRMVGEDFAELNNDVYHRRIENGPDDVQTAAVRVGEGRSTLRRLTEKFDVIELSGTDTYTAGNAGAYVLSESYLYTREALGEYFDHLKPGGTLGVIRLAYDPPRESLRLFAIALSELRERGVERPSQNAVVIYHEALHERSGEIVRFTVGVFSPDPIPADAIALYSQAGLVENYRIAYYPGMEGSNPFTELGAAIDAGTEEGFYAEYPWDVRPVGDDSPFFFNFHHWSALWGEDQAADEWNELTGGPIGLQILGTLLVQTTLLTALLVIVPLLFLRRSGLDTSNAGRHLVYFLCLGAGFMFLEISTAQRLVLFLGHPTYSLTVTLSCFLFFAGLGSLWSRRFHAAPARGLRRVIPVLAAVIVVHTLLLDPLLSALLHLPLPARIASCVAVLAPLNFLMGIPFPIGLARLQRLAPSLVPWAPGANGGASVIASILCIVVAMESGFRTVSLVALAMYVVAVLAVTTGPLSPARSDGA